MTVANIERPHFTVSFTEIPCLACNCDVSGATDEICTKTDGECLCKEGYGGERCDR